MKDNRMDNIVECAYNMDNGYVEVWFTDGNMLQMCIRDRDDTGVGSSAAEVATWVLKNYVKMFQLRNPQLYVIGAYIHLDEDCLLYTSPAIRWTTL